MSYKQLIQSLQEKKNVSKSAARVLRSLLQYNQVPSAGMGSIKQELTREFNTTSNSAFKDKTFIPFLEERDKLGKLKKQLAEFETQESEDKYNLQLPTLDFHQTHSVTVRATYKSSTNQSDSPKKPKRQIGFNSSSNINPVESRLSRLRHASPSVGSYKIPSFADKYQYPQKAPKEIENEYQKYKKQIGNANFNTLDEVDLEKAYDSVKRSNKGIAPFGKSTARVMKKIQHKLRLFGNLNYYEAENFEHDFIKLANVNHKANYIKKKQIQFHRLPIEEVTIDIKNELKQVRTKEKDTMGAIESTQSKLKGFKSAVDIHREKKTDKKVKL